MRRGSCVGVILLLALGTIAVPLQAQDPGGRPPGGRERGFSLGQNYPNPFNPSTTIRFALGQEMFEEGRPVVVTIRILNTLLQPVAVPTALNHPEGNGVPVQRLTYDSPGPKEAYWDGLDRNGNKAASGLYFLEMSVNGQPPMYRRMLVAK